MGCIQSAHLGKLGAPRALKGVDVEALRNDRDEIAVFNPLESRRGEGGSRLGEITCKTDFELSIGKLPRVSSQYMPTGGMGTVKVPSGGYELQYSYLSQKGYYPEAPDKVNQDSYCIHSPLGMSLDDHLFGVFDGHGEFGAQCSRFVKLRLAENLVNNSKFNEDSVEALRVAYLSTNAQLHADAVDDSMSGTTAVTVLVRGRMLYVANAGDSRAVIGEKRGNDYVAVDLSIDQTPFRPDELERVKNCGARVLTLDQIEGLKDPDVQCWGDEEGEDGDPPRLWVPNGTYPGTAFTRSIGDSIAETIGVVADPEIVVFELTRDHPFFVIASDGVFEFLSSQTVVDMVTKHKDPRDACAEIVAESYRLWLQYETRTDDITLIVVHVNGLMDDLNSDAAVQIPHVVQVAGSESNSKVNWRSRNHSARSDISRAQVHALESSLENGQAWAPSPIPHRKTRQEEAHIERALCDHFIFRKFTDTQVHVLLDCMRRVEFQAGEIVVKQGEEGNCFFVVGSGEFDVFVSQDDENGGVPRVLQRYTAAKLSSFGELALMSNKPLQTSVRAVTDGTLWALKREDFRGILVSEFSNLSSLKLLRSIKIFSRLTILELGHIANSLFELSFSDGQQIADENGDLLGLYIIQTGVVKITYDKDTIKTENTNSLLMSEVEKQDDEQSFLVEKKSGSYFGEWTLFSEQISPLLAIAVGDVVCSVLTKEKFESVASSLGIFPHDYDDKLKHNSCVSPLNL